MKRQHWVSWFCVMLVSALALVAATVADDPPATEAERAYEIKETMLCPVCDGQNVLESNAPVASAIRAQVDQLVSEGRSNAEIRAWMARQYGNDVNANPSRTGIASLVWVVPVFLAVLGAAFMVSVFRKWRVGRGTEPSDDDIEIVSSLRE